MAENPCTSEPGMMNMSHSNQALPHDLQNIVMPLPKGQGVSMPINNMNLMPSQNRYGNPVHLQNNGQGSTIPSERYMQQPNNTYAPDGRRNYSIPVTGISQESYVQNPMQEGLTSNVMGATQGNRPFNMNVPYSHNMENPSQVDSLQSHTNPLAGVAMGQVSPSKPKVIQKPDPDPVSGPDQRVPNLGGLPPPLQNEVTYKITTSDVTEAISAIRTTGSRVTTANTEPNDTSAGSKSPHHLVVTAMGLVRKPTMPDPQNMETTVPVQNYPPSNYVPPNPQPNLPSPVRVGPKPQLTPTMTETTRQTFTYTNTHPSAGPVLPENEMIPSSHVDHVHSDPLDGRGTGQPRKQGGRSAENTGMGSSYTNTAPGQGAGVERKAGDTAAPLRKSYRPPKRKGVMDYDDITGANDDDSQALNKKSKTMPATSSAKNTGQDVPSSNRPLPKSRAKLTVEEVYSGDDGDDTQTNSEFLKVRMIKCDKCDKHFIDKKKLSQHKRQVHNSKKGSKTSSKDHVCDVCNYVFKRREHWRRHKEVHQKSRPYSCDVCNKTFKRAEHVKRHQSVHLTSKPYPCMECSSAFTRGDHLAKHMLIHSDPDGYRQNQLEKKRKARVAKSKTKGAKMIKTVPRGRGKVTVQLRATVPAKKQEEDFEYGDISLKDSPESDTDENDLLSSEEEEDTTFEEQKIPISMAGKQVF